MHLINKTQEENIIIKIMNIGTPLTSNATRVALCGSGELGKEVVIELQRYGCEVIAIDRYENAPAMQVAHRSYNIDMLDADELRSVLEKEKPHLKYPDLLRMGHRFEASIGQRLAIDGFYGAMDFAFGGDGWLYVLNRRDFIPFDALRPMVRIAEIGRASCRERV